MISRRGFAKGLVVGTAFTAVTMRPGWALKMPDYDISLLADVRNKFVLPPILKPTSVENDVTIFDLTCQAGLSEFLPGGLKTPTLGISAPYLGPVLALEDGKRYRFNFKNDLAHKVAIHWHGMHIPAKHDGGPHQMFKPGETWSPEFTIDNKQGNYWYHTHTMHKTAEEAYFGLAGWIVIFDKESADLEIPKELGVDDFPLVVQDRKFNADGSMEYNVDVPTMLLGMRGETMLITGQINVYIDAVTSKIKLRLLNGSNARYYNFGFEDNRPFYQIATDGGYMAKPLKLTRLPLTPGERVEIIVDLKAGEVLNLLSYPTEANTHYIKNLAERMSTPDRLILDDTVTLQIVEIRAADQLKESPAIPAKLVDLKMPDETKSVRSRKFVLAMDMLDMNKTPGLERTSRFANAFTINGKVMDMKRIDEYCKVGETEIWEFINASSMPHNMHVHDVQFKVLNRTTTDGKTQAPFPYEIGLKDTVNIDPGEIVRVVIEFGHYSDPKHPYMYHCHTLEHEDQGMMGQFVVV